MPSSVRVLLGAAMLAVAHGQGVILSAKGDKGTSTPLQVLTDNDADANFISDAEISSNLVNECGRTLQGGNIDVGATTEDALANGTVTQVTAGSKVDVTIDQRNANGTGPFVCDMDVTGNSIATGQTVLDVSQDTSGSGTGKTTLKLTMPTDMACIGSSAGNVCTVRCRNANDFGGCFAVQQTDTTALPGDNPPSNINGTTTTKAVDEQVKQNQKDLAAATAGNNAAASDDLTQSANIAAAILAQEPSLVSSDTKEVAEKVASAAGSTATTATNANTGTGKKNKGNKGNKNANANANNNAANANANNNNNNAATANANANNNAAQAAGNGNGRGNRNNNNKREPLFERRRRFMAEEDLE